MALHRDYLIAPERYVGQGVLLRSYHPGDGAQLRTATNASYEHLKPWMPWATRDQSLAEAERLVRTFRGRYLLAEDFVLAIRSEDDARLIGGAGYHLREAPLVARNAELGMWIRADSAGQGLGSAALRALLAWGFDAWPWRRLTWRCDARNVASRRVAEKAGMRQEGILRAHERGVDGELRDTVCYALLRSEWTGNER